MEINQSFTNLQRALNETDIQEIETALNFSFPKEIRAHYMQRNGGSPENCLFNSPDRMNVVSAFLPVKYGKKGSRFEDIFEALKLHDTILPDFLVPFAIDPGGDFFCFSIREKDNGAIFWFCGDYYDEPEKAVHLLSPSLKTFINELQPYESVSSKSPSKETCMSHQELKEHLRELPPKALCVFLNDILQNHRGEFDEKFVLSLVEEHQGDHSLYLVGAPTEDDWEDDAVICQFGTCRKCGEKIASWAKEVVCPLCKDKVYCT